MQVLNVKMAVTFNGAAIIFACASQSGAKAWALYRREPGGRVTDTVWLEREHRGKGAAAGAGSFCRHRTDARASLREGGWNLNADGGTVFSLPNNR